jgi:hypothetical protein
MTEAPSGGRHPRGLAPPDRSSLRRLIPRETIEGRILQVRGVKVACSTADAPCG